MYCASVAKRQSVVAPTLIGRNLVRLLDKHRLTQKALAARCVPPGVVSEADISRIKNGDTPDPSGNKLRAIAAALGEPLEAFWADPEAPADMDPSLAAFLALPGVGTVTDDEKAELAMARLGALPPLAWQQVLAAIRIRNAARRGDLS
jgi:transcriptional regulator with XRE-family HTH domain